MRMVFNTMKTMMMMVTTHGSKNDDDDDVDENYDVGALRSPRVEQNVH